MNEYMTIAEIAEYIQVHPKTIYKWIKDGRIKATKLKIRPGQPMIVKTDDVKRFIKENTDDYYLQNVSRR